MYLPKVELAHDEIVFLVLSPTIASLEVQLLFHLTQYGKCAPSGLTYIISTWFDHQPPQTATLSAADPDGALGARVACPWIFASPLARASLGCHSSSPARLVQISTFVRVCAVDFPMAIAHRNSQSLLETA
ncbi:hypothetical protein N7481_002082 [Penicillium waksmanii]|uniref:uncharacterized protein n=1 Tax=Penicillium waksmanii TaxID=69791 RepID=UPI002547D9DE|nr:uncharacterized protein N7481_002082 [Penicillium waksmanii]KAJ5995105.1 hypothetical protein N7481_002082 [Penicillium waksmanii]